MKAFQLELRLLWNSPIRIFGFVALLTVLGCVGSGEKVAGTVDDTHTGQAMIFNPDGHPAEGAIIKVFQASDTTRVPVSQLVSDQNGSFQLKGLAKGYYNLYAQKGALVAFQDSISVLDNGILVQPDTLENSITLSGIVGMQPNHDPRTATVEALGSGIFANVDAKGNFTLKNLASGNYTLRATTTLDNYTPTYLDVSLGENAPGTLSDTLWLIYTGIPVVQGLKAEYDTLSGVVKLKWDSTTYRNFASYLIYRDPTSALLPSTLPLAGTKVTTYEDSLYKSGNRFSDTNVYDVVYRIKILDKSGNLGESYLDQRVISVPPYQVKTNLDISLSPRKTTFDTTSDLEIVVNARNPSRLISTLQCMDGENKTIDSIRFDTSLKQASRTIHIPFAFGFHTTIHCTSTDNAGSVWSDSLVIAAPDLPVLRDTTAKANYAFVYPLVPILPANSDYRYFGKNLPAWSKIDTLTGSISGNLSNSDTGKFDAIQVYVSDGKLLQKSAPISITILRNAWKLLPPLKHARSYHASAVLNGKVYVMGGEGISSGSSTLISMEVYDTLSNTWSDGVDLPIPMSSITAHSVGGKLYVFGGFEDGAIINKIYEFSPDLNSWKEMASMPTTRMGFTSSVVDGKVYGNL